MFRANVTLIFLVVFASAAAADQRPISGSYFAVIVSDVEVAGEWYRRVLQLDKVSSIESADRYRIVNLARPGLFVELLQLSDAHPSPQDRTMGPFKLGFLVADIEAFVAALPAEIEMPGILSDERNGLLLLQLRDPEGNVVQVMQVQDDD